MSPVLRCTDGGGGGVDEHDRGLAAVGVADAEVVHAPGAA
jgi:hypothetical protein